MSMWGSMVYYTSPNGEGAQFVEVLHNPSTGEMKTVHALMDGTRCPCGVGQELFEETNGALCFVLRGERAAWKRAEGPVRPLDMGCLPQSAPNECFAD